MEGVNRGTNPSTQNVLDLSVVSFVFGGSWRKKKEKRKKERGGGNVG